MADEPLYLFAARLYNTRLATFGDYGTKNTVRMKSRARSFPNKKTGRGPMRNGHTAATVLTLVLSMFSACGCSAYLYDKRRDKTAKEVTEAFQKASAGALFNAAATDLSADQSAGRAAFPRLRLSRQDVALINLIDGVDTMKLDVRQPNAPSPHPAQQLKRLVRP